MGAPHGGDIGFAGGVNSRMGGGAAPPPWHPTMGNPAYSRTLPPHEAFLETVIARPVLFINKISLTFCSPLRRVV